MHLVMMVLRALVPRTLINQLLFAVRNKSKVESNLVSRHSTIGKGCYVKPGAIITDCSLGNRVYVNSYAKLYKTDIASYCSLGPGCEIGANEHMINFVTTCELIYPKDVLKEIDDRNQTRTVLAADVWVGAHAVVLKGVKVGVGAVIAAGAVVTKDVEPYTIVGGVPAKPLRKRFAADDVEKLMASRWWEKPEAKIREALSGLPEAAQMITAFTKSIGNEV